MYFDWCSFLPSLFLPFSSEFNFLLLGTCNRWESEPKNRPHTFSPVIKIKGEKNGRCRFDDDGNGDDDEIFMLGGQRSSGKKGPH